MGVLVRAVERLDPDCYITFIKLNSNRYMTFQPGQEGKMSVWLANGVHGYGDTPEEALAQALCQALGVLE